MSREPARRGRPPPSRSTLIERRTAVYVCVCHAVTEDDVRCRIAEGACSAKAVRVACGMRPGCGSCVGRICALIDEHNERPELAAAQ